jgi:hypothetical protein
MDAYGADVVDFGYVGAPCDPPARLLHSQRGNDLVKDVLQATSVLSTEPVMMSETTTSSRCR